MEEWSWLESLSYECSDLSQDSRQNHLGGTHRERRGPRPSPKELRYVEEETS